MTTNGHERELVVDALAKVLADTWTEPLSKRQIARLFGIGRDSVDALIETLDAKPFKDRFRLLAKQVPPKYWSDLADSGRLWR